MSHPWRLSLAALSLALVAAADRSRVPEATPAGAPVTCLHLSQIRESRVRDDRTIDWFTRDNRVYRTTLAYACPELGFEQRFAYETSLSELCQTDIITVFHTSPVQRGASCGLAPFQPVTLADARHRR
ncbi:hypothetical protein [Sphingomonas bacterium]|uniref:hypothetical protein n=1 Tax=Sphingomonas bacterium TaxID=1895847 RepID=UPI001574F2CE|nr:hypothetical protein [Sphingomonas bacterium]